MAKKANNGKPGKPDAAQLVIDGRYLQEGELGKFTVVSEQELVGIGAKVTARALAQPEVRAARAIQRYEGDSLDINYCADELRALVAEVHAGGMKRPEAMLVAQAHTLDALFSSLVLRSHANTGVHLDAADRYMRLALKAQAQAVRTIEALGELKNPRPVAFVKQANIVHGPQQVNNGIAPRTGETINQTNELSEGRHELLPDTRASEVASRLDTALETVGAIDRSAHR